MLSAIDEDGTTDSGSLTDDIVREGAGGCRPPHGT
ncbi:hypothetical protein M2169_000037 [Streptomyces sp. MJP52]|nr:hypothetical protein [Streptomyces sp. MJP52]